MDNFDYAFIKTLGAEGGYSDDPDNRSIIGAEDKKAHIKHMRIDLTGERFGYLKVISYAGWDKTKKRGIWDCVCDCGKTFKRESHELLEALRKRRVQSCGCMKSIKTRLDLVDKKFGKLLVVESLGTPNKHRQQIVRCLCDCGKEITVKANSLVTNRTRSCGCLQREKAEKRRAVLETNSMTAKTLLYGSYKCEARSRKKVFELTKEEFFNLTSSKCHYCGKPPLQISRRTYDKSKTYIHNGIDRKDPLKGYTFDNVVPCCKQCNFAKHRMGYDEFLKWVECVYFSRVLNVSLEQSKEIACYG